MCKNQATHVYLARRRSILGTFSGLNLVYTSCIHARSTPMSPRPAGAGAKGLAPAAPAPVAGAPAPNGEDATAAAGVPNGDAAGAGAGAPNGEAAGAGAGAPKPNVGAGAGAGCCPKGEGAAGDCSARWRRRRGGWFMVGGETSGGARGASVGRYNVYGGERPVTCVAFLCGAC